MVGQRWKRAVAVVLIALVGGACDDGDEGPSPAEATCERVYAEHVELVQESAKAGGAGLFERMSSYQLADAQLILQNQPCFDNETVDEASAYVENELAGLND